MTDYYIITGEPIPPTAEELAAEERERRWAWTDALVGCGDPQDGWWPELSATHGGTVCP
jgi:hypothetical protein